MSESTDPHFYDRADAFIHLANDQNKDIGRGKVSASFMYAVSRFNAWVSARGFETAEDMQAAKQDTIAYFVKEYTSMLEENLDDYIQNFNEYLQKSSS